MTTKDEIKEVLVKARDLLDTSWTSGAFVERKGDQDCFCLVGAVEYAAGYMTVQHVDREDGRTTAHPHWRDDDHGRFLAFDVKAHLRQLLTSRGEAPLLTDFNDRNGRVAALNLVDKGLAAL